MKKLQTKDNDPTYMVRLSARDKMAAADSWMSVLKECGMRDKAVSEIEKCRARIADLRCKVEKLEAERTDLMASIAVLRDACKEKQNIIDQVLVPEKKYV